MALRLTAAGTLFVALWGCGSPDRADDRSDAYLLASDTAVAIEARRVLFESLSPLDSSRVQLATLRILSRQSDENGSWGDDATSTGRALVELRALDKLPPDDPAIRHAVSFLLGRDVPYLAYQADSEAWGQDWIALYAVDRWGFGEELKVRETVHALLDNRDRWLDGRDGRAASAIVRAITSHPLLAQPEKRELIVEALAKRQLPAGLWDLGPGTSQLAVLGALLPFGEEPRVKEQVNRFLAAIASRLDRGEIDRDPILTREEAHFVVLQAVKLAGKLDAFRKGESLGSGLAPYEVGVYVVARPGEQGHALSFQGRSVNLLPEPILLGPDVAQWREILSPDGGDDAPVLRLFLRQRSREAIDRLIGADPSVESAVLLRGRIVAVRRLAELRDQEGLAVKGLDRDDAVGLVEAVGKMEAAAIPAVAP